MTWEDPPPMPNRRVRTDGNPESMKLMGLAKALSFQMANTKNPVMRLYGYSPDGSATVWRHGSIEIWDLKAYGGLGAILLSSAEDECYAIPYKTKSESIEIELKAKLITLTSADFFADTYVEPTFDLYSEICPFIYTLDQKNFIIVIGSDDPNIRDDWHNNSCQNLPELPPNDAFRWYYYSWFPVEVRQSDQYIQGWGWNYGFSPFSYYQGLTYLNRFIDHNKRLYIPILGRGSDFEKEYPKLAGCENGRYGKKPFTITEDGVVSWKEVVTLGDAVPSPEGYGYGKYYGYNMQTYWPFAPYLREIANLDIQAGKKATSLWYPAFFYNYKMQYYTGEGMTELPLRSDIIDGSFPAPVSQEAITNSIVENTNSNSGENNTTNTRSQSHSLNLKKYTSLGTIGERKDLHVVTELVGNMSSEFSDVRIVERASDIPDEYYALGWLDDLFWSGGPYHDSTNCSMDVNIDHTNRITGTQKLMAGDIEIDSGDISMVFTGIENCAKKHNGTTDWRSPKCTSIAVTTLQMSVNGSQTLVAYDKDGNICSVSENNCSWAMISGGGSIDVFSGVYTAPSSNPGCDNPVIGLFCDDGLVSSVTIAVNAVNNIAGTLFTEDNILCTLTPYYTCDCTRNCQNFYCDGTYDSPYVCGGGERGASKDCTVAGVCAPSCSVWAGVLDGRTAAMIAAGCCPIQLL